MNEVTGLLGSPVTSLSIADGFLPRAYASSTTIVPNIPASKWPSISHSRS